MRWGWALLLLTGCDPNGFPHFNEPKDLTGTCDALSTTWVRTVPDATEQTTELWIVGGPMDGSDTEGCLYVATLTREGSMTLDQGTFALDDGKAGTATFDQRYVFERQEEEQILGRDGAHRVAYEPVWTQPLVLERKGTTLQVERDGAPAELVELMPLVTGLDLSKPGERVFAARLLNLGLLVSQVRVLGFGGAGMTAYIEPATFSGLVSGELEVEVELGLDQVDAVLDYRGFSDLPGLRMDGPQVVAVDWAGNGQMDGEQAITVSTDVLAAPDLSGTVDLSGGGHRPGLRQGR